MAKKRQLVLTRPPIAKGDPTVVPLGPRKEVMASLANFNLAPDGTKSKTGMEVLWGPGMVMEWPASAVEVSQAMVSVSDDDIAWPVLQRLCKLLGLILVDLESGRSFGGESSSA
jgi:hypothetical protein